MLNPQKKESFFVRMHPLQRILISLILAIIVQLILSKQQMHPLFRSMVLWDVFAISYVITCWIVFIKRSTHQIRNVARQQDGSRFFVFAIILIASFVSMAAVMLLIVSKDRTIVSGVLYFPITIVGMLISWLMVHTTFTFHYAHLYYDDSDKNPEKHAEGLQFPGDEKPDYLDFAYFAFVIGMTFQVSDVSISRSKIRRMALVHSLLSFGLNTFVVALTINIIAGVQH